MEVDPEPTPKMTKDPPCTERACPCRALDQSADAWGAAALSAEYMDPPGRVIDFVPVPKVRRR